MLAVPPPSTSASGNATRKNQDGTISFITTVPGISGFPEFLVAAAAKRTFIVRDAQHEYLFTEQ
jgi:hypothetical protein